MLLQMVAYFYIYSVIGWSFEVTYGSLMRGMLLNPGVLIGPWCPIYGFGMLGVIKFLKVQWKSVPKLFFGAVFIASFLEMGTGILLETLFHQRWWDYSNQPLNLGFYVCLPFSLAWGVGAIVMVKTIHPFIKRMVEHTSHAVSWGIISIVSLVFVMDISFSLKLIEQPNQNKQPLSAIALMGKTTKRTSQFLVAGSELLPPNPDARDIQWAMPHLVFSLNGEDQIDQWDQLSYQRQFAGTLRAVEFASLFNRDKVNRRRLPDLKRRIDQTAWPAEVRGLMVRFKNLHRIFLC